MTVRELIYKLEEYPDDEPVHLYVKYEDVPPSVPELNRSDVTRMPYYEDKIVIGG